MTFYFSNSDFLILPPFALQCTSIDTIHTVCTTFIMPTYCSYKPVLRTQGRTPNGLALASEC
jgi:hypothetical protein